MKFRVEVQVKIVPYDTNVPVVEKTAFKEWDQEDFAWRSRAWMDVHSKAAKLATRAFDAVFGEEEI